MATDEPKNTDDLLSRRLNSRTQPSSGGSAASSDDSDLEDTQSFEPFSDDSAPTRQYAAGSTGTSQPASASQPADDSQPAGASAGGAKPSLLSNEEWALLGGGGAGAAAGASGNGNSGSTGTAGRSRKADVPGERRFGVLDIIGTIWITLAMPFVLAAIAVRAVASGFFLMFEYFWRPGFPPDQYGFTAEDRLHYGSYAVDYLNNLDSSRYLADVVLPNGVPVFEPEEIAHMADVKSLVSLLYLVAVIAAVVGIIFALWLSRRTGPGIRHGIRYGAILTLVGGIVLGVLAVLGWDQFFTGFHALFFEQGTWQFYLDDSLIRLFPGQFWIDAGIAVGIIILLGALIPFLLTFVGSRRRRAARQGSE